ncbi:MAG: glycoside hydrolase family 2 protein [Phycisphaerales bacterium]
MSITPLASSKIIPDLYLHDAKILTGPWNTIIDPYETGFYDYRWRQRDLSEYQARSETFYLDVQPADLTERIEYNFDESPMLEVPGDWNTQRESLYYYEGTLWYRTTFDSQKPVDGSRVFLRFGAANYRADVYLNGKKLGVHIGGFTPFNFECTDLIENGRNSLVVRVDNKRYAEGVPTLNTDWWNYGGLTRDVRLIHTPSTFIREHRLELVPNTQNKLSGSIQLNEPEAGVEVRMRIAELDVDQAARTDSNGKAEFRINADQIELWSPESPKLYSVEMIVDQRTIVDQMGFRTIQTKGKQLLLNGEPVFLRGISIHDELPLGGAGRTRTESDSRQLLEWAKELGCNFVRLAHYPHPEYMTRLADEMGLLVWSEVPVYWTIDWENEDTYLNAENQLTEMIKRDMNRSSVIIWSLANETPVGDARTEFLTKLAHKARSLDQTRLLSLALEKHSDPDDPNLSIVEDAIADLVDVVSFNQYVGWYDGLPSKTQRIRWKIPYDMPVIVSEFGAGAKAGKFGDKSEIWTEEFQADLYTQTLEMLDRIDGFAGVSPWILSDFRSPRRLLPGIQDGYNRKGLIGDDGSRKKAFYVLQEYYRQRAVSED